MSLSPDDFLQPLDLDSTLRSEEERALSTFAGGSAGGVNATISDPLVVAILTFFDGVGHVVRSCKIGAELAARGHNVVVGCAEGAKQIVERFNLTHWPIHEVAPLPPEGHPPGRSRLSNPQYLAACLDSEARLLAAVRPDVVLVDFRVTGTVSSAAAGVPCAWLANLSFLHYPLSAIWPQICQGFAEIGVTPPSRPFGEALLVPSSAWLEPLDGVPAEVRQWVTGVVSDVRFVGPIPSIDGSPGASDRRDARRSEEYVYVTFGGLAAGSTIVQRLLPALAELDMHVVVSMGPHTAASALSDVPPNVAIRPFDNNYPALIRNASVVVHHGGHTTLIDAMYAGIPAICLPQHDEQRRNGRLLEELGTGKVVELDEVGSIAREIKNLLSDTVVRDNCEKVARLLSVERGAADAADALERIARWRRVLAADRPSVSGV